MTQIQLTPQAKLTVPVQLAGAATARLVASLDVLKVR
jgi:hypothetical protein